MNKLLAIPFLTVVLTLVFITTLITSASTQNTDQPFTYCENFSIDDLARSWDLATEYSREYEGGQRQFAEAVTRLEIQADDETCNLVFNESCSEVNNCNVSFEDVTYSFVATDLSCSPPLAVFSYITPKGGRVSGFCPMLPRMRCMNNGSRELEIVRTPCNDRVSWSIRHYVPTIQ